MESICSELPSEHIDFSAICLLFLILTRPFSSFFAAAENDQSGALGGGGSSGGGAAMKELEDVNKKIQEENELLKQKSARMKEIGRFLVSLLTQVVQTLENTHFFLSFCSSCLPICTGSETTTAAAARATRMVFQKRVEKIKEEKRGILRKLKN